MKPAILASLLLTAGLCSAQLAVQIDTSAAVKGEGSILSAGNSRLVSCGPVPKDLQEFYTQAMEMSDNDVGKASRSTRTRKSKFVGDNTLAFAYLFASGSVLYGDPLSNYASVVLDTLLLARPSLKGKLRIYVLKSSVVNAFTSNDGKVFITVGLLARVRTRAELAFILAHEVMHYVHADVYESFEFSHRVERLNKRSVESSQQGIEDLLRTKYSRSQEQEWRADVEGTELYQSSPFGNQNPKGVFDLLATSERTPFEVVPEPTFFTRYADVLDTANWVHAHDFKLIDPWLEVDTVHRTHPSLAKRKDRIVAEFTQVPESVQPVEDPLADRARMIAGCELAHVHYANQEYAEAILCIANLLHTWPNDPNLLELEAKCYFALANLDEMAKLSARIFKGAQKGGSDSTTVHDPWTSALRRNLSVQGAYALYSLAYAKARQLAQTRPEDRDLQFIQNGSLHSLRNLLWPERVPNLIAADSVINPDRLVVLDQAEGRKRLTARERYAQSYEISQARKSLALDVKQRNRALQVDDLQKARIKLWGDSLINDSAIDNLVGQIDLRRMPTNTIKFNEDSGERILVLPLVWVMDTVGKEQVLDPRKPLSKYLAALSKNPSAGGDRFRFLPISTFMLDSGATQAYNDYALLLQMMVSNADGMGPFRYLDLDATFELYERSGAPYVTLSSAFGVKRHFGNHAGKWVAVTILIPGGIIAALHSLFFGNYTTYFNTRVYDLRSGQCVHQGYARRASSTVPRFDRNRLVRSLDGLPPSL